ncbi:hypothetical protein HPB48_004240 [Haemaphysalis longicornis]|uniref:Uncharacterized protein n=1 Tax=Haemaphysalis longicornis TaxID=44386 RepID=A0A9J6FYF2_HAELO|nr:hypothetical protein HPB48_004240 [Haemaphysalis longicornis]
MGPTHSLTARPTPGHGETTAPVNTAVFPLNAATTPRKWHGRPSRSPGKTFRQRRSPSATKICSGSWRDALNDGKTKWRRPLPKMLTASSYQSSKLLPRAGKKGPAKPAWKPKPLPKFHPEDFVVVLKPRSAVELGAIFQPRELGLSLRTYLGAQLAADFSFVLSREQNPFSRKHPERLRGDRILGDFVIKSAKGDVLLRGHLKKGDEEVSYGVVSIANHETSEN